jgi:hypothetical protein
MADDISKKISIDVQLNTDGQQQIDQYKASFDSLRTSINNLGKPISDLSGTISSLDKDISKFTGNISKLNSQNKDLNTTGNKLKSTFSDLTSTFSTWKGLLKDSLADLGAWTNEISAGLTILIQYGPAIVDWVSSLIKGKEAVNQTKMSVDALNKALDDTDYSNAIEQFNDLKAQVGLAKQGLIDKKQVLNEYNDTLGKTMGQVSNLGELEAIMTKKGGAYIQMTLLKAAANIALQDAANKAVEAQKAMMKSDDEALTLWDKMVDISNHAGPTAPGAVPTIGFDKRRGEAEKLKKQMADKRRKEEADADQKQSETSLDIFQKFLKQAAQIAKDNGLDPLSGQYKTSSIVIKKTNDDLAQGLSEAEKIRVDSLIRQLQATNQFYSSAVVAENEHFNQEKGRLTKLFNDKQISRKEYNRVIEQLEAEHRANMAAIVQKYRDEDQAKNEEAQNQLVQLQANSFGPDKIERQLQEVNVHSINLVNELTKHAKISAEERANFEIQTTQKVSDTAFSIIGKSIQAQSDAKIKALEADKALELNNKSLTASQRQAIEQKYQKQENAIKVKVFKSEQKASIAQAIINGAIAITKAEAQTGVLGALVIPGIIAETAIQIAAIAAQKPPAMAKGGYFRSDGKGAVLSGYSRTDDTNAFLRSGEAVVVSEAMRDPWARNLVSAINVAYGGRDFSVPSLSRGYAVGGIFTDGGNANRYYNQPVNDQKNLANTVAYQMINNFPPVYVDVKDINNQQNILAQTINRVNL